MIEVLSLGAGVQSSCVLMMSCVGELPKLDCAIFADTQWEPPAVYKWLSFLEAEAKGYGIPVHRVTRGDLRADAIQFRKSGGKAAGDPNYKRWASMPLFVLNPDGTTGLINRQCTSEYKIEPIEKFIKRELIGLRYRQRAPKAPVVRHWFGISADEIYRVRRSRDAWQVNYYPLIETIRSTRQDTLFGRGLTRDECLEWMASHGYPEPPRSACIGCPYHSDEEWVKMQETDPRSFADAIAFDLEIRSADSAKAESAEGKEKFAGRRVGQPFLHRSCVPLAEVVFKVKDKQAAFEFGMGNECEGMCGV